VLVATLVTYADAGDPQAEKRRMDRARNRAASTAPSPSEPALPSERKAAAAAVNEEDNRAKFRLAALSANCLLVLAYFHAPALAALRPPVPEAGHAVRAPAARLEAALYHMLVRRDACCWSAPGTWTAC